MDKVITNLFGPDYCHYGYTETKHCEVVPGQFPLIQYHQEEWEKCGIKSTVATTALQQ